MDLARLRPPPTADGLQTMTIAAAARDMTCADATVPTRGSALIPRISHAALFEFVSCSSSGLILLPILG